MFDEKSPFWSNISESKTIVSPFAILSWSRDGKTRKAGCSGLVMCPVSSILMASVKVPPLEAFVLKVSSPHPPLPAYTVSILADIPAPPEESLEKNSIPPI